MASLIDISYLNHTTHNKHKTAFITVIHILPFDVDYLEMPQVITKSNHTLPLRSINQLQKLTATSLLVTIKKNISVLSMISLYNIQDLRRSSRNNRNIADQNQGIPDPAAEAAAAATATGGVVPPAPMFALTPGKYYNSQTFLDFSQGPGDIKFFNKGSSALPIIYDGTNPDMFLNAFNDRAQLFS